MKKIIVKIQLLILIFLFTIVAGCNENPVGNNSKDYNGSWVWLKSVGGFSGGVITPQEGVTLKIVYDNFNTFKIYRNDSIKVFAKYRIEEVEKDWDKITYSNISTFNYDFDSMPDFAEIHSDTLTIWDGMIDGFFSFYKKIN